MHAYTSRLDRRPHAPQRRSTPILTQLHVEHPGGGDDLQGVGGQALVVARVGGVQVGDAQLGARIHLADRDASLLLHHGGVVLQPADGGSGVPRHPAVQRGRLALEVGDVVDRAQELQVEAWWRSWNGAMGVLGY